MVTLLHEREDIEGEADALHSLATLARREGDYRTRVLTHLDRAIALSDANSAVRPKCGKHARVMPGRVGRMDRRELEFRAALQSQKNETTNTTSAYRT